MLVCPLCRLTLGETETICPRDGHDGAPARQVDVPAAVRARFTIVQPFGQGATGEMYLADDQHTGRRGVLKMLRLPSRTPAERARLKRELVKQATLASPTLSVPLATGDANGVLWLFREWTEGVSLRVKLARGGALAVSEALSIAAQVAAALDELHRSGLLHRDVKPGHIILNPQPSGRPRVTLIDAGIAARIETGSVFNVVGTPHYVSPEQAKGQLVSFRSDLYALGCVLFEMLAGVPPFDGTVSQLLEMHADKRVPALQVPVPTGVTTLLGQLLAKDPRERPFSAQQVRRALEPYLPEDPASKREATQAFERLTENRRAPAPGKGTLPPPAKGTIIGMPAAAGARRIPPAPPAFPPARSGAIAATRAVTGTDEQTARERGRSGGAEVLPANDRPAGVVPRPQMKTSAGPAFARPVAASANSSPPIALGSMTKATPEGVHPPPPPWQQTAMGDSGAGATPPASVPHDVRDTPAGAVLAPGAAPSASAAATLPPIAPPPKAASDVQPKSQAASPDNKGSRVRALLVLSLVSCGFLGVATLAAAVALWYVRSGAPEEELASEPRSSREPSLSAPLVPAAPVPSTPFAPTQAVVQREAPSASAPAISAPVQPAAQAEAVARSPERIARQAHTPAEPAAAAPSPVDTPPNRSRHDVRAPTRGARSGPPEPRRAANDEARTDEFNRIRQQALEHFNARRFAQAAAAYERATELNPRHPGSFAGLGASWLALGQHARAVRAYRRAVELSPRTAGYHAALGRAYLEAGDGTRARQAFTRALSLDPNNRTARQGLEAL